MPKFAACSCALLLSLCCLRTTAATPSPTEAPNVAPELIAPFQQALESALRVPGAAPAMAAAIVQGDAPPWLWVQGQARADRATPVDADTRFYIASQTKSFIGLLAATLDVRGEFPLTTSLADVWPDLRLPAPADPQRIRMADLLSHQEGLSTDTLNFLTAYVRDVSAAQYPRLLASEVGTRAAGFRYANIGDLIYGAALEARTGRNWRSELERSVLRPLQLDQVSARSSDVPAAQLSWSHQWDGARWRVLAPKPDSLMHAAGGLVASPRAMARWMQANLGIGEARGALPASVFERSQQPIAQSKLADGEIDCSGYSLGWYRCRYRGQEALMHPGSYAGAVSVTVLLPSARAGLSLMANSDSAMESLQLEWMKAFIGIASGQPDELERLRKTMQAYPANVAAKAAKRRVAIENARADAQWGGWSWRPDAAALRACSGRYENALYGTMRVERSGQGLIARVGALELQLEPAQTGLFAATSPTLDPPEPLRCEPDERRIVWRKQEFRG